MSGHSKWHNIQAKKGKADAARGAVFTKIGREIAIAVRDGGANPESNGKLRDIIAKAKANNMPNDNIQRSIKKASGELSNVTYEQITYEGYAPGGVAVIVDTITDNRNRTASDVRHCFAKNGGNLGTTGSVSFMFDEKGVLVVERTPGSDEEEMMMMALDAGADYAGGQDLVAKIQGENWFEFDTVIASPNMMGVVGRLGKVLGPKGLMPSPKAGTVTPNIANAIKEAKAGKIEYRLDKTNIIHCPIGKVSFGAEKLTENYNALIGAIIKAKPAAAKGQYIKSCVTASTMGPGIKIVTKI